MYKIETHMHTSEASACAICSGAEMARKYKALGYDGIIITDHFFNGNSAIPASLPWEKRVEGFCSGFENARAEGEKIGLDVYFGWEYGGDFGMEFLTYGLDKDWLLNHPKLLSMEIEDYLKLVKESGGFVSQAHPFRRAGYIMRYKRYPSLTEGAEAVNFGNQMYEYNELAIEYSEEYHLIKTAGTDAHSDDLYAYGGMIFENRIGSIEDFIAELRGGQYTLIYK